MAESISSPVKKEDRRVRRSKRLLKQAFAALMLEKEFREITVKDITERADLNRGTFYLHYNDTVDLLGKMEQDVLNDLQDLFDEWRKNVPERDELQKIDVNGFFSPLFDYIEANHSLCACLLQNRAAADFMQKLQALIRENGIAFMRSQGVTEGQVSLDYFFSYIAYGTIGTLLYWFQTGQSISREALVNCCGQIAQSAAVMLYQSER